MIEQLTDLFGHSILATSKGKGLIQKDNFELVLVDYFACFLFSLPNCSSAMASTSFLAGSYIVISPQSTPKSVVHPGCTMHEYTAPWAALLVHCKQYKLPWACRVLGGYTRHLKFEITKIWCTKRLITAPLNSLNQEFISHYCREFNYLMK